MRINNNWKAKKGLIRVSMDIDNGVIRDISISGDFFMFPEESIGKLEDMLKNSRLDDVSSIVHKFYSLDVITPGVEPDDFIRALEVK